MITWQPIAYGYFGNENPIWCSYIMKKRSANYIKIQGEPNKKCKMTQLKPKCLNKLKYCRDML